ncbi:hypothetical protein NDU88_006680 [Pleurodeles waltl]|uniref:Uncharacterized protein n=1 Tax=Pleurodeles waltl TaxID=8319 RepID=A0AAV7MGG0_PLEWA|nr:hypothetical protein NDU88_006680 [Pleurodeles waltl]
MLPLSKNPSSQQSEQALDPFGTVQRHRLSTKKGRLCKPTETESRKELVVLIRWLPCHESVLEAESDH